MSEDDVYLTFRPTGYLDRFEPRETDYLHELWTDCSLVSNYYINNR